jgi:isopenicillin-N epimerase
MLHEQITFLNHGSFGAVPRVVFEEQEMWRRRIEAEPIELLGRRGHQLIAAAKQTVARWLGMEVADFGFVSNATEGINAVLRSLDFAPGDELLTTSHVYNAVRQAMKYVAGRTGALYRELDLPPASTAASDEADESGAAARASDAPSARYSAQAIADAVIGAVTDRTRLVVIDHITSPTALVFPVEQIVAACARRGVDVLVDGAHAAGMIAQLNVPAIGAAYYAGNLHKWACCPKGCGFLWVRPDLQPRVHPVTISHHLGEGLAREFGWQGTRDISAWLAAPRALAFMNELGWDRVIAHNHALARWAQQMLCVRWNVAPLSPLDGGMLGSMATVQLPAALSDLSDAQAGKLQQRLYDEFRVEVPVVQWMGKTFVRPCCQVYNMPADYERLADVAQELAQGSIAQFDG